MEVMRDRHGTHGDFKENAAMSQMLKLAIHGSKYWYMLSAVQRESLDMICLKISRILSGHPDYKDHWRDLAGYAILAMDACEDDKCNE
jgi:hypothetical protein